MKYLLIFAGGGLGAVSRFTFSRWIYSLAGSSFPIGTLIINLTGCFAIGFLTGLFERYVIPPDFRLFIFVGFLGGYTTFSSFGLESFNLMKDSEVSMALTNVLVSNIAGLVLVGAGYILARLIFKLVK